MVDITTNGGLLQAASGTLIAGELTSSGSIAGPAICWGRQPDRTIAADRGGTLTVVDHEALTLAGIGSAGTAGIIDISTNGSLFQGASGTLIAGELTSSGSIAGPAILLGTANQIGTITGLTAGGTLTVVDHDALTLAGIVSAGNAGIIDISTNGSLFQGASGTLIAGELTSTGNVAGPAILLGTANQIGTITGLTAGGTLTVVDHDALTLAGMSAPGTPGSSISRQAAACSRAHPAR